MKPADLLILAAAGLAAWFILRRGAPVPASPQGAAAARPEGYAMELNILNDGGWRYFDDGTAIGPDGAYYSGGVKVWMPQ